MYAGGFFLALRHFFEDKDACPNRSSEHMMRTKGIEGKQWVHERHLACAVLHTGNVDKRATEIIVFTHRDGSVVQVIVVV